MQGIEWTPIIVSFASPVISIGALAVIFYAKQGKINEETERRMNIAESDIKGNAKMIHEIEQKASSIELDLNTKMVSNRLFYKQQEDIKDQLNKIWTKVDKIDTELKEIYKNGNGK